MFAVILFSVRMIYAFGGSRPAAIRAGARAGRSSRRSGRQSVGQTLRAANAGRLSHRSGRMLYTVAPHASNVRTASARCRGFFCSLLISPANLTCVNFLTNVCALVRWRRSSHVQKIALPPGKAQFVGSQRVAYAIKKARRPHMDARRLSVPSPSGGPPAFQCVSMPQKSR